MKTVIPHSNLVENSWAEDFTHARRFKQQFLYLQAAGHYVSTPSYAVRRQGRLHSHLLLYTRSGVGRVDYQGRQAELPAGALVLLNCEYPHAYRCLPTGNWEFDWLHFSGECIEGYLSEILENWDVVQQPQAGALFKKLIDTAHSYEAGAEIIGSTLLIELCSHLLVGLRQNSLQPGTESSPIIRAAIAYLEENYEHEVSLDSLCNSLHISKYYFSHFFKEQTGSSPYEYLINLRITHSKTLLRTSGCSVAEIAERTGFGNSSYYIQTFRSREGLTPLRYRNYFLQLLDT